MAAETGVALVIISFLKDTSPGDAREWKESQDRTHQESGTPGH